MTTSFLAIANKTRLALAANKLECTAADRRAAKVLALVACLVTVLSPDIALATPWDGMGDWVMGIFTGGLARTIAVVAIIACGISALVGKLSWQWAINIVLGIVLIFGGATIVDAMIGVVS